MKKYCFVHIVFGSLLEYNSGYNNRTINQNNENFQVEVSLASVIMKWLLEFLFLKIGPTKQMKLNT